MDDEIAPIVLGQVGLGSWGPNLLRNFNDIPGCEVKLCCDVDADALERVRRRYPLTSTTLEYEDLLADDEIDAIVISSPSPTHYDLAIEALRNDKHVLVEKPIALSLPDAEELIAVAKERGLMLMVGHLLEYHPGVTRLKKMVDTGDLGDIYYIYSSRLNLGQVRRHENAMWSLAPHDISVILYLLGEEPVEVSAQGMDHLQQGIQDTVFLTMHFSHKKIAHCHVSWLDPHKVRKITVVGARRMAVFDDTEIMEKLRMYDKGVEDGVGYESYGDSLSVRFGDVNIPRIDMREPLRIECEQFLECIRSGRQPLTDGLDGLRVLRVLDAGQRSLEMRGQPVACPS